MRACALEPAAEKCEQQQKQRRADRRSHQQGGEPPNPGDGSHQEQRIVGIETGNAGDQLLPAGLELAHVSENGCYGQTRHEAEAECPWAQQRIGAQTCGDADEDQGVDHRVAAEIEVMAYPAV